MGTGLFGKSTAAAVAACAVLAVLAPAATAQVPGQPVMPIPGDPGPSDAPEAIGGPVDPDPAREALRSWRPPQNPHLAPDPNSNLHNDAYQTDAYRRMGPLGRDTQTLSTFMDLHICGSITFDAEGRIVTVCIGFEGPLLVLLDPDTFEILAVFRLPLRDVSTGLDIFTGFSAGGYFYLDDRDRAVIPTTTRHIIVVAVNGTSFEQVADYDLGGVVAQGDAIVSALADWGGRIWFVSKGGAVGWVDPADGSVHAIQLGEHVHNSFAVDETGGVFVVSDAALYRFDARGDRVKTTWRRPYRNIGVTKPGQTQAGSGTTPTLIGRGRIAITDNADPMRVVVYERGARSKGRKVCAEAVFEKGASATDQSLIAAGKSIITENNYGYSGITATESGATTAPGLTRVDVRKGRCKTVWESDEIAPSVVPKLSLKAGLVYTYTKPANDSRDDSWYFTALDYDTGETAFKRRAGGGLGFNNNYAPVTIGPDGTAYVGVLGGLTLFRDGG